MPGRHCMRSVNFTQIKQIFMCTDEYNNINIRHHSLQRNMLLKFKKMKLTLTVMKVKPTLAQNCKHFNSPCSLHVIHPQLLKPNIYFCIYIFGFQKSNIYVDELCTSAKTCCLSQVAVRLIKHRLCLEILERS